MQKFCIRETKHLSTNADSITAAKKLLSFFFFIPPRRHRRCRCQGAFHCMFSFKVYPNPENCTPSRMVWMVTFCRSAVTSETSRTIQVIPFGYWAHKVVEKSDLGRYPKIIAPYYRDQAQAWANDNLRVQKCGSCKQLYLWLIYEAIWHTEYFFFIYISVNNLNLFILWHITQS